MKVKVQTTKMKTSKIYGPTFYQGHSISKHISNHLPNIFLILKNYCIKLKSSDDTIVRLKLKLIVIILYNINCCIILSKTLKFFLNPFHIRQLDFTHFLNSITKANCDRDDKYLTNSFLQINLSKKREKKRGIVSLNYLFNLCEFFVISDWIIDIS